MDHQATLRELILCDLLHWHWLGKKKSFDLNFQWGNVYTRRWYSTCKTCGRLITGRYTSLRAWTLITLVSIYIIAIITGIAGRYFMYGL